MSVDMLIGRKEGMTHVFDEEGRQVPVTVVTAGPCPVVQIKTPETDGYHAVQLGFGEKRPKTATKPVVGHYKKAGLPVRRLLREARLEEAVDLSPGDVITVGDVFAEGQPVDVVGTSKGRGFAGTIKRHGFGRGPMSHGSKNVRELGSTGMHTWPGRVFKGKRMSGQYGAKRCTVKNLRVVRVDAEHNRLYLLGAVPGPTDGFLIVRRAKTPPAWARRADKEAAG
jgi:large subunit ribosomal protein L3